MLRHLLTINICVLALVGVVPARGQADDEPAVPALRIDDITPFGGVAVIPADADTRSLRFEGFKAVRIPTRIRYTADPAYCGGAVHEPGGSMFCPQFRAESTVAAYQVTYSYTGEPLGSDEHGGRRFTLQVYFRPSELPASLLQSLAGRGSPHGRASSYFVLSAVRESQIRYVGNEARSVHCEGTYIDGNWQQDDPECDDILRTDPVSGPSDFITVKVTPRQTEPRGI
jgi:hypothetical protein